VLNQPSDVLDRVDAQVFRGVGARLGLVWIVFGLCDDEAVVLAGDVAEDADQLAALSPSILLLTVFELVQGDEFGRDLSWSWLVARAGTSSDCCAGSCSESARRLSRDCCAGVAVALGSRLLMSHFGG
jgi:hypothetical protein